MINGSGTKKPSGSKRNAPSNKTRWSYWMQAIEHVSKAINKAFPGYHPQWVIGSQNWNVNGESFRHLREFMLGITQEQCGAYLRVDRSTVSRWESGDSELPFAAFELLRLVYESTNFKLSHPDWDGWYIGKDGRLVTPCIGGLAVTPQDIESIPRMHSEIGNLKSYNAALHKSLDETRQALAEAQAANTRLREQFVNQGVVDEIDAMHSRLGDLLTQLNTAKVYQFPATTEQQPKEAVA